MATKMSTASAGRLASTLVANGITKAEFRAAYKTLTLADLCDRYSISTTSVYGLLDFWGIPHKQAYKPRKKRNVTAIVPVARADDKPPWADAFADDVMDRVVDRIAQSVVERIAARQSGANS